MEVKNYKIAVIHDWLTDFGGAEKVLQAILELLPNADIFTVVDHMDKTKKGNIANHKITTSFVQNLPMSKKKYRSYLPLMPIAIEQFDLSDYDIVLSSSYAVAKGVITGPDQLHICYCHSPIRYAWDMQFQYLKESNLTKGLKSKLARYFLHKIRIWDNRTSNGVDHFVSNSRFIAKRIKKVYGRNATTIYPNVNVDAFKLNEQKEDFYLTASRMVPYKKIYLIVEAFNKTPSRTLHVIGDGPDFEKIKAIAKDNVN
jgi:glycosyltransferase involved in cell wall biosynthesis